MTELSDREDIKLILRNVVQEHFGETLQENEILFGDVNKNNRQYVYLKDYDELRANLAESLQGFSSKNVVTPMLSNYVIEHMLIICRILKLTRGCGLLIGLSGTGKRGITKLAAYINEYP